MSTSSQRPRRQISSHPEKLQIARLILAAIAVLCASWPAAARDADSAAGKPSDPHVTLQADHSLSLGHLVRSLAAREYGSSVVDARQNEAAALRRDARQLFSDTPSISGSLVSDQVWNNSGYRQWDANLELPLWWPGQLRARRRNAAAANAATPHAALAHELDVAGWVRRALADIEIARLRLDLAESKRRSAQALADQVEQAVALEELAQRELVLARSATLEHELDYLEALEEWRHSESTFFLLTGSERFPQNWFEEPQTTASLAHHPLLLLARQDVSRAASQVEISVGNRWGNPVLSIGTQHERDARGADFNDRLVAGMRIPLGRIGSPSADSATARRVLAEARRDAGRLERDLRSQIEQARHRLDLADERIETASAQAAMAAQYRDLTDKSFELGEADLSMVLRARARFADAEQARREALLVRHVSAAAFNQSLGVLP